MSNLCMARPIRLSGRMHCCHSCARVCLAFCLLNITKVPLSLGVSRFSFCAVGMILSICYLFGALRRERERENKKISCRKRQLIFCLASDRKIVKNGNTFAFQDPFGRLVIINTDYNVSAQSRWSSESVHVFDIVFSQPKSSKMLDNAPALSLISAAITGVTATTESLERIPLLCLCRYN